jgi:hypothetical protein
VVRPRRHDERVAVAHEALFLLVEDKPGLTLLDAEDLIDVGVNLVAALLSWLGKNDA